jgi:phthiodiolone/phenolphthiodiolone dimycocerosates ketoreductase
MARVTLGYVDGCLHPLWTTTLGFRIARRLGARSLWVPDHYVGFFPPQVWKPEITPAAKVVTRPDAVFDPIVILTMLARRYRGVDVGTAVTEPFRRHPMSLAQSFVTLDHVSRGRAILGIGNGERENVEPYGIEWSRPVARLEEALAIVRLLWASGGKPVDYDGRLWKLRDAVFDLPLYKGRQPRIYVAAHAPRMLALTGHFADGWLPSVKGPPEDYRGRLAAIAEAAGRAGRSMDGFVCGQMLPIALGESRRQVLDNVAGHRLGAAVVLLTPGSVWKSLGLEHPLGPDHPGFHELVPQRVTDEQLDRAAATMTPALIEAALYAGSPREIADEVAPLVEAGARHLVITNMGAAFGGGLRGLRQLAELMRRLRRL